MIDIWQIGNTGVRNPMRLYDAFKAYAESDLVGNIRGVPAEKAFMVYLDAKGVLNNEDGKDPSGSYGRKFRFVFNLMGFAYNASKAFHGLTQEQIGPIDGITPFGKSFLAADTIPAQQECYCRGLSVPMEELPSGGTYSPLRWTLRIMLELEKQTGESTLNFIEFATCVQTSTPEDKISDVIDKILKIRRDRNAATGKKVFDTKLYDAVGKDYPRKSSNFKDYGDMNRRYLLSTGVVRSKGKGLAIVSEKHKVAEELAKELISHETILQRITKLYNGAPLPTDNIEVANTVLKELSETLTARKIPFALDSKSLKSSTDVNNARKRLEALLAQDNELIFAHDQKNEWREIATYMDLIVNHKERPSTSEDEDNEIYVPKNEASAYLEWCLWRAFLAMNTLQNKPHEVRRFNIDQDFKPIGTAPGNGPDLVAEYKDCSIVIEVTLSDSSRQEAMEGEPVRRHVSDHVIKTGKPAYGLFIANNINTNTAETFRNGTWYTKDDVKTRLCIVPVTLKQFRDYFVSIFESGEHANGEIINVIAQCVGERDELEAPEWKARIKTDFRLAAFEKTWNAIKLQKTIPREREFIDYLPVFSLSAACGKFGNGEKVEPRGWIHVSGIGKLDDTMFVVRAQGDSMEPLIHNGDLCIMRKIGGGSYENKTMLVQHRGVEDPETGGAYSIKKFTRNADTVILKPRNADFDDITLRPEGDDDMSKMLVGEFWKVL